MPWHPPIPFGALYTEDAIKLGSALALLGYCYDNVDRKGWVKLSLRQVSAETGVSYATVKRWWDALKDTSYIAEHHDHRRGGMEIRIADIWLDWWREERYEKGSEVSHQTGLSSRNGINTEPLMENIVQESSRKGLTSEPSDAMYKVLSRSEEQEREDRDGTARSLLHPAVVAYHQAFPGIRLNQKQAAVISELVGGSADRLECWQEVIQDYELSPQWKPEIIGNLRSRFENKLKTRANGKQPGERPPLPVMQPSRPDNTVPRNEIAARLLANRGKS